VRKPLVHGPGRTLRVRSPSTRAAPAGVSRTARIWRDAAGIMPLRRVVHRTGPWRSLAPVNHIAAAL